MTKSSPKIDFIGIGAQKAATTWIYNCLIEHPEICGAREKEGAVIKELHYFHKERRLPFDKEKAEEKPPIEKKGVESYKNFFSRCESTQVIGEYTPAYLYYEETPLLIKNYFPDVKLIACLRNPIERAYSQYSHEVQHSKHNYFDGRNLGQITFEEAIKKEPEILKRGLYHQQLKRYYERFPEENILILIYENIQKNPLVFIKKIYDFLGVDTKFEPQQVDIRINQREGKKSFLSKLIHTRLRFLVKQSRFGKYLSLTPSVRKLLYSLLEKDASSKQEQKINSGLRQDLKDYYEKDIRKLENLLNKDLTHWK